MIELIEISGEGCANCFTLLPIVNKLASERNLPVRHIEVNEGAKAEVEKYRIERVPTLLVMDGEKEIARCAGFQPEEILELWLDAKIEQARK